MSTNSFRTTIKHVSHYPMSVCSLSVISLRVGTTVKCDSFGPTASRTCPALDVRNLHISTSARVQVSVLWDHQGILAKSELWFCDFHLATSLLDAPTNPFRTTSCIILVVSSTAPFKFSTLIPFLSSDFSFLESVYRTSQFFRGKFWHVFVLFIILNMFIIVRMEKNYF